MRLAIVLGTALAALACGAAAQEMVPDGAMEGPYTGGVSRGWDRNCYGVNDAVFAPDYADRHGGRVAQRVTCTRFADGGVQFHSNGVSVQKGQPYTLRFWLKGTVASAVWVGVRKHSEPYTPYLKRDVRCTPAWRPYVICGESIGTDPDCGVYIMFTGTGTLLVDDVSLVPGLHPDVPDDPGARPRKGNRVYNAGFEAGPDGWAPTASLKLDAAAAHTGRAGALLGAGALECRPFAVQAGRRYTLTAWVRSTGANARCTLRLREWADSGGDQPADRHEVSGTADVGAAWTRCRATGVALPNLWDWYVARVEASGPAALQVDDVQVEEGGETPFAPMSAVEVGARTDTRWCRPGDTVAVRATVSAPPAAAPVRLVYTLEDAWSRVVTTWRRTAAGPADTLTLRAPAPGCYRVRVTTPGTAAAGEVWFGVFAPGRVRSAFLGAHVTDEAPQETLAMRQAEAMGAGWVRLHDFGDFCHWYRTEPEKGRWVWRDAEVDDLCRRGFRIVANLGHPPAWAGRQDPRRQDNSAWSLTWTNAPPRDIREWEDYVGRVVSHYRGRIRCWEIWNEPFWVGFFCGTPREYTTLLETAYRAIKRADPQAIVVGGCFSRPTDEWTRDVLAAGALRWMDVLSYHAYWAPDATEAGPAGEPPDLEQQARGYLDLMRRYGAVKPLWMTEGGIAAPPMASWLPAVGVLGPTFAARARADRPITRLSGAAGLVKGLAEMRAAGVEVACYYYTGQAWGAMPWFSAVSNGAYVLMDFDGRPKPTMMAYAALARLLEGARPATVVSGREMRACVFAQGSGSVAVSWSSGARDLHVAGATARDLMGNQVVGRVRLRPGEPVYLCAPRLRPEELARRLGRVGQARPPRTGSRPATARRSP